MICSHQFGKCIFVNSDYKEGSQTGHIHIGHATILIYSFALELC